MDPATAHRDRPVEDSGDTKLLEAFYAAHDIDQRVRRSDFMERYLIRRQAMHPPLRLSQELKRTHGALLYPGREPGSLN
jgi:hypothetical protein